MLLIALCEAGLPFADGCMPKRSGGRLIEKATSGQLIRHFARRLVVPASSAVPAMLGVGAGSLVVEFRQSFHIFAFSNCEQAETRLTPSARPRISAKNCPVNCALRRGLDLLRRWKISASSGGHGHGCAANAGSAAHHGCCLAPAASSLALPTQNSMSR
jgi:hypothetical protein